MNGTKLTEMLCGKCAEEWATWYFDDDEIFLCDKCAVEDERVEPDEI